MLKKLFPLFIRFAVADIFDEIDFEKALHKKTEGRNEHNGIKMFSSTNSERADKESGSKVVNVPSLIPNITKKDNDMPIVVITQKILGRDEKGKEGDIADVIGGFDDKGSSVRKAEVIGSSGKKDENVDGSGEDANERIEKNKQSAINVFDDEAENIREKSYWTTAVVGDELRKVKVNVKLMTVVEGIGGIADASESNKEADHGISEGGDISAVTSMKGTSFSAGNGKMSKKKASTNSSEAGKGTEKESRIGATTPEKKKDTEKSKKVEKQSNSALASVFGKQKDRERPSEVTSAPVFGSSTEGSKEAKKESKTSATSTGKENMKKIKNTKKPSEVTSALVSTNSMEASKDAQKEQKAELTTSLRKEDAKNLNNTEKQLESTSAPVFPSSTEDGKDAINESKTASVIPMRKEDTKKPKNMENLAEAAVSTLIGKTNRKIGKHEPAANKSENSNSTSQTTPKEKDTRKLSSGEEGKPNMTKEEMKAPKFTDEKEKSAEDLNNKIPSEECTEDTKKEDKIPATGSMNPEISELFYILKNIPERTSKDTENPLLVKGVFVEGSFKAPDEEKLKDKGFQFSGYVQTTY